MAINLSEVSFDFDIPNFDEVPEEVRQELVDEIGEYLLDSILDYVGESKTPVAGGEFKKELSDAYKKISGKNNSNLDFTGSMLDSLEIIPDYDSGVITIGIFDPDEAPKAYNHQVGDTLPVRQFIPNEGELLKAEILRGVGRIIEDYLDGIET
jgi:hypothetical protein